MEKFLIISHVIGGSVVLLLGLFQMFSRKGGKGHVFLGKIYVGALWWVCLSAFSIITFYRFSAFLLVIAILTFHTSFVGVRVLQRKIPGTEKWYDWLVSIVTSLFGIALIGYGVSLLFIGDNNVLVFLCIIFGVLTFKNGTDDIRFFLRKNVDDNLWWLYHHIGSMGGSYIAAVTAFAVQNPSIFIASQSHQWLLWIIPPAIGNLVIVFTLKRKKLSLAKQR